MVLMAGAVLVTATAAVARGGRTSAVDCDSNDDDEACREAAGKAGKHGK